jgi:hypothetical protein
MEPTLRLRAASPATAGVTSCRSRPTGTSAPPPPGSGSTSSPRCCRPGVAETLRWRRQQAPPVRLLDLVAILPEDNPDETNDQHDEDEDVDKQVQPAGAHHVLIGRNDSTGELAYYRCVARRPVQLSTLVRVAGQGWGSRNRSKPPRASAASTNTRSVTEPPGTMDHPGYARRMRPHRGHRSPTPTFPQLQADSSNSPSPNSADSSTPCSSRHPHHRHLDRIRQPGADDIRPTSGNATTDAESAMITKYDCRTSQRVSTGTGSR